jgi:hypothetical protein
MKKALILSGLLLVLSASLAIAAPGLHLSWDDCGANGSQDRGLAGSGFSCNSNSNAAGRANLLVGTYIAPPGVTNLAANEVVLDYQMGGGSLPVWWNFNDQNCLGGGTGRAGQLLFAFRSGSSCNDWPGSAGVSGNMTVDNILPDRARIKLIGAFTSGNPQPLVADQEYNSFTLTINNAGTLGTACPGCATPGCFVLNQIILNTFPESDPQIILTNPGPNGSHTLWRGGTGLGCPGATPTQKSTWGQLKSLYR